MSNKNIFSDELNAAMEKHINSVVEEIDYDLWDEYILEMARKFKDRAVKRFGHIAMGSIFLGETHKHLHDLEENARYKVTIGS